MIRALEESNPFYNATEQISDFVEMLHGKNVYGKYKGCVVVCKKDKSNFKHLKWINVTKDYNTLKTALEECQGKRIYILILILLKIINVKEKTCISLNFCMQI